MVVDSNSGAQTLSQIHLWSGAADYIGLDPYPCYTGKRCDYAWIDTVIQAADAAGLDYWGVVQAFRDTGNWRWPTADEFDLFRPRHQHAAFGFGPHFCVGHHLARTQMHIAIRMLFERLPNLRLDPDLPVRVRGWEYRAPTSLPVRWDA